MIENIAALCFKVNDEYSACIYSADTYRKIDWDNPEPCNLLGRDYSVFGYKRNVINDNRNIQIAERKDGNYSLRLKETKRYIANLCIRDKNVSIELPHLQNQTNKFLKVCEIDDNSVSFQFINYLGRSRIFFRDGLGYRELSFEVVPDKINYDEDYIELTEAVAKCCAELLLEYSGSTSNPYRIGKTLNSDNLLEQFIFLRQFCFNENIRGLFEAVKRNPDRILIEDPVFRPFGAGVPYKKFYSQPFSYSRNWKKITANSKSEYFLPEILATSQKQESLNTPANRFLKYALEYFRYICDSLSETLTEEGSTDQIECVSESRFLSEQLDDILRDPFFDEIGDLDVMPQNNQVLQKREGYSQIFYAYSMIDLSLELNWEGKDQIYEGESKNVALLYEYWLFFELYKVICDISGEPKMGTADEHSFITTGKDGGITVFLKEGTESCQHFNISRYKTKINLYYNRTFRPTEFRATVMK